MLVSTILIDTDYYLTASILKRIIKGNMRYTVTQFHKDFPSDDVCLQTIFENRYGDVKHCPKCAAETTFYRIKGRKCYACQWCGYQLHPLAQTIFHKSETPLTSWFYAIYLFSISKNGVAAKELERHLGVTYKTAHRMANRIRSLMAQDGDMLSGIVEIDETYIGGRRRGSKRGRGVEHKVPVVGVVERDGGVRAQVTVNTKTAAVMQVARKYITIDSVVNTDQYRVYNELTRQGYDRRTVNHARKEYVNGDDHTNTIEGFWGQMKRSINGTYHMVSPKYLQTYVDEFAFRYNLRGVIVYPVLLEQASKPSLSVY